MTGDVTDAVVAAPADPNGSEAPAPEAVAAPEAAVVPEAAAAPEPNDEVPQPGTEPGQIQVTRPGTFTASIAPGTDVRLALRMLGTQSRKNIIVTSSVRGQVAADLYEVTFQEALEAILRSAGLVYVEKGPFIYVMTPKELTAMQDAERELEVRVFRLSYVKATDVQVLVRPALSKAGSIALTPASKVGIATSKTEAGGDDYAADDVLVVRDYAENLAKVAEIVKQIDVKPQQVLIEATILRATLNEDNALGIDFNTLAGIDFQTLQSTSPQLTNLQVGTLQSTQFPDPTGRATFRTDFNSAVPTGGLSIGVIFDQFAFFLRALESVTDVTVLANPKLLVVNKQRGEVMVGNRDGYLTTTVTETVATQTVQFLETGTRLVVRPFIGGDGFIRLEIHPEDSSGTVSTVGTSVLPSETTTEVTSNVLVRDGHTIVIGGLFRERTVASRAQVPALGNVPLLGMAFRRTADTTVREEVIILITPHIIRHEVDEAVSAEIAQDVERFRAGMRKGLQWWGRGRIAQFHMAQARDSMRMGMPLFALWHADLALSMDPKMLEAMRLKEEIQDKAYWHDQPRESSVQNVIQRMIMTEIGKDYRRVVAPDRPANTGHLSESTREAFGLKVQPADPLPTRRKPQPHTRGEAGDQAEIERHRLQSRVDQSVPDEPAMALPKVSGDRETTDEIEYLEFGPGSLDAPPAKSDTESTEVTP